jgi:hypothetical protein
MLPNAADRAIFKATRPLFGRMPVPCDHSGTHSGATRYSRETAQLRLVVVCDACGCERGELNRVDYRPRPVDATPSGRGADPHAATASVA